VLKTESEHQYNRKLVLKTESEHQYNRKLVLKTESEHQYNRKLVLNTESEHQYNRNGNTSQYCSISGQTISTTGMAILVSTAPLLERTSVQQEW
jgi:hypothetical protein